MALTPEDKTWIESALAKALGQTADQPEPEPPTWEGPDYEALTFRADWSDEFDLRSGGRGLAEVAGIRASLRDIARGRNSSLQQRQRANQLLAHPLLNSWIIATDTPEADGEAEIHRKWNAGPLDDVIIPGGGATFDRSRLNETDWRTLGPKSALRYVERSGGAEPVGSIPGCFVYEKMTGSDVGDVLQLFADQWMAKGEPPRTSWDERFRPR